MAMAHEPFSVRVASPAWRAEALDWIGERLAERGVTVTGEPDQLRIRPWSTQITVPTDHGTVWFKATCPAMSFEPALQELIADLVPDAVCRPWAVDAERGWMLTPDHGPTVGDLRTPTEEDWRRGIAEAARVQRRLADHRDDLLAIGLPDAAPDTVPGRFDRLLELYDEAPELTGRVAPHIVQELRSRRAELLEACALLDASPVPATWQHGDLHPRNLHETDGGIAFFDLGDGMWSHAVEILSVPYGVVSGTDLAWERIVTAWTDEWQVDPGHFDELWRASAFTHAVNRAVTWHRALLTATADEVAEWGDAVEYHLSSMLDA